MTKNNKKDNLTQQASKGAFWSVFSNITVSIIRFVVTAIIARILMPEDFGLIGMAMVFTEVIKLIGGLGLSSALIQQKEIDEVDLSTAFWTNNIVSVLMFIVAWAVSPLAAVFFKQEAVALILQVLSINFLLSGIVSIQNMYIYRDMQFKKLAIFEIISTVFRVIVVLTTALLGFSFWSIIIGMVVERFVKTVLFWFSIPYKPQFIFDKARFWKMFKFGRNLFGSMIISYFNSNMDFIVTGRVLGARDLGFYQFAFNIPNLVFSHIGHGINQVTFPLFCKVQDDVERLGRGFLKLTQMISLITFPLMMGLFSVADSFILSVYGIKYVPSIEPLRIICFAAAVRSVFVTNGTILTSIGRPDMGFKWSAATFPVSIAAIAVGSRWNLNGIAYAMLFLAFMQFIMAFIITKKIKLDFLKYLNAWRPAVMSSLLMMAVVLILNQQIFMINWEPWQRLFLSIVVGLSVYTIVVMKVYPEAFGLLKDFIMRIFAKKESSK